MAERDKTRQRVTAIICAIDRKREKAVEAETHMLNKERESCSKDNADAPKEKKENVRTRDAGSRDKRVTMGSAWVALTRRIDESHSIRHISSVHIGGILDEYHAQHKTDKRYAHRRHTAMKEEKKKSEESQMREAKQGGEKGVC